MNRYKLREYAFKLLFRVDFHPPIEYKEQEALFWDLQQKEDISHEDILAISQIYEGYQIHQEEIDALIKEHATRWQFERMGKAERAILRLAVYEMRFQEEVPIKVAVNEAINLAKVYGTSKSPGFVNAILAKIMKES